VAGWGKFRQAFKRRRWRVAAVVIVVLFLGFCGVSADLFMFAPTGMPARVDAIVVLGGTGDRLDLGMQLAREDRAPYLVLSMGLPWLPPGICTQDVGPAKVICFQPSPDTTQGEAEGASKIAKQHGWSSMVLVTTQDQVWRARLRFGRCYSGKLYSVSSPLSWYQWPYAIAYQWAGTFKAEVTQRSC
jgi:uncharacterized SAM-binding protein YcdF (DUF218 family)